MIGFILRRALQLAPVLLGITVLCFLLLRILPGDPATLALGARGDAESIARLREQLGLNEPLWRQFLIFLGDVVTGSFGESIAYERPVSELVTARAPATLWLVAYATAMAVVLTVPFALLAAKHQDRPIDDAIKIAFMAALAMPQFWLGLILILLFAIWLPLFPTAGYGDSPLEILHHLTLPAFVLALATAALTIRSLRSGLLAVLKADYVDTARAKGLSEARVLARHVLPNGLISTISVLGVHTSWTIGGTVVIEAVFALPGLGGLFVEAIFARDYSLVQGLTVTFALLVVTINLVTDLAYAAADPRVRLE